MQKTNYNDNMTNDTKKLKRGRPQVVYGRAMVMFHKDEKEFFTKWMKKRVATKEEQLFLGMESDKMGISDAMRFLIIRGIEKETGQEFKSIEKKQE